MTGCGAPGLDAEQGAEERRTCASLRERVAVRALDDAGILAVPSGRPGETGKPDALSPVALVDDPPRWYASLAGALADADLGPSDDFSPVSPASRLIDRCRHLEP